MKITPLTAVIAVMVIGGCGARSDVDLPPGGVPSPGRVGTTAPPSGSHRTWNPERIETLIPYSPGPVKGWMLKQIHDAGFPTTVSDAEYLDFLQVGCRDMSDYAESDRKGTTEEAREIGRHIARESGGRLTDEQGLAVSGWSLLGLCPDVMDRIGERKVDGQ